jgi:dTDP-4-amino-4,6-dideoxygalactose transaminase
LDPLEAAVVSVKLPFLREWTERRREIAAFYASRLSELDVGLPAFRPESSPTFYCYVIRVRNRDAVYRALRRQGIEAGLYYLPPVYRQPVYRERRLNTQDLPVTDRLADELLCLPAAPELLDSEIEYVVDTLREVL